MIKEVICTGTTIEEAIENAKKELNAPAGAEVKTEVLAVPEKKLFIKKPGKVRAFYEIPDEVKAPIEKKQSAPPPVRENKLKKEGTEIKKPRPAATPLSDKERKAALDYLRTIMEALGVADAKTDFENSHEGTLININCGDDFGILIGRRGETLDSIQYLVNLVVNKGKEDYTRFTINVDNYREKREITLQNLAKKTASHVLRSGRNIVLEPMNPYERRIIHTAIQEIESVTSHSIGSDINRRVVIQLADGARPSGGRYNNNRRGLNGSGGYGNRSKYNNNYGRGGDYRRQSGSVEAPPKREPRQDVAGASLYGKIEVSKKED